MSWMTLILSTLLVQVTYAANVNSHYESYAAKFASQKIGSVKNLNAAIPEKFRVGPKDQKTFKDQGDLSWAELKSEAKEKVVTLNVGQETLSIEFVDSFNGIYKYNGKEVNLSQYKSLTEKFNYLERVLSQKTGLNFNQHLLQTFLGANAEAFIPLLIWGGVAVAAWGTAAYEACNAELICSNDEARIQSSVASVARYVNLTGTTQTYSIDISCKGSPYLKIKDDNGDFIYDSNRSQVEMNRDTGNSSYTTLAMDLRNCCRTNKNKCEKMMRDYFKTLRKSVDGSSESSSRGGVN